jgi:hypothetical protein
LHQYAYFDFLIIIVAVGLLLDDKQIKVSDYVAMKLEEIKRKEQHKSMDSVIRMLIQVYEAQKT